MKVNQTERWLRLLFAMVVLLFGGIIYAWAILKAPFGAEFGWDAAQLSLNYTLTIMFFCIGGFVAGLLSKKTSPRFRFLLAAVLLFSGFFITSRLDGGSVWGLYLAYGVLSGVGIGFVYTTVIGLTAAWFPDNPGLCSGLMLMGFGLTSLVIGGTADSLMKMPSVGWRATYLILAIALGVIFIAASFIIRAPKEGTIFPERRAKKSGAAPAAAVQDYSPSQMVRRLSFWTLFIIITLIAAVGSAAIALAADILKEFDVQSPAAVIGVISIFNGLGRLTLGALFDSLGIRRTQIFISVVALAAPVTMVAAILSGWLVLGIIGLVLCYFSYGFAPTMSSVFSLKFYGSKNFSQNFSILNLILIPAPFAAMLAGTLYSSTQSFLVPFAILTGCAVVGLLLNLSLKKA